MQIYINRDGQQFGPFSLDQVNQGLVEGQLLPNDFAFYEGLQQWTPLGQIQGVVVPGTVPAPIQAETVAVLVAEEKESVVVAEPVVTAGADDTSKKKKVMMIAGISAGVAAVVCVLLFVYPGFLNDPEILEVQTIKPIIPSSDQSSEHDIELPDISEVGSVSYFRDIKIIFEEKCINCHGSEKKKAALDLSSEAGLVAGADGEPIYVAGNPEESLLVKIILSTDLDERMPPGDEEPLNEEEKKKIIAWIEQGGKTDN